MNLYDSSSGPGCHNICLNYGSPLLSRLSRLPSLESFVAEELQMPWAAADSCSIPFRSCLLRLEEDTFGCSCSWPKCIAIRQKLLGGRNLVQEPSAIAECDVAGDVAGASLKKHRSRFVMLGFLFSLKQSSGTVYMMQLLSSCFVLTLMLFSCAISGLYHAELFLRMVGAVFQLPGV
ncbi:hypothetical protein Nepgr_010406 [Nepenthes gracilis]|uniref:Uncharacterized protein n=1 Tax=Nepenthes gracilis TaxID=150966 RepID=A0AAD3XLC8_NEPGR|nr:hypothetical protein Nepgr_010406 [Nepenthes gracilis]